MNRIDPSSQPLELTTPFWIGLALVALVGVARWLGDRDQVRTLEYLDRQKPVIVRSTDPEHRFPSLGIRVALPVGWAYVSVTDDAIADRPTFINESTNSIVSLRRFAFASWPPADHPVVRQEYGQFDVEWVEVDHRSVGRLTEADVDLAIIVVTHQKPPPNKSIDEFCKSIQLLGTR